LFIFLFTEAVQSGQRSTHKFAVAPSGHRLDKSKYAARKKKKSHQETLSGCHSSTCDKKNGCKWKVILDTQDFSLNKHGLTED